MFLPSSKLLPTNLLLDRRNGVEEHRPEARVLYVDPNKMRSKRVDKFGQHSVVEERGLKGTERRRKTHIKLFQNETVPFPLLELPTLPLGPFDQPRLSSSLGSLGDGSDLNVGPATFEEGGLGEPGDAES